MGKRLKEPIPQKNFCQRLHFPSVLISALAIASGILNNLSVKHQNLDVFEENIAKYFHDLDLGKNFLKDAKVISIQEKTDSIDDAYIRNFIPQKTPEGKWKDNWEELIWNTYIPQRIIMQII